MYKTKLFHLPSKTDVTQINNWLEQNKTIKIVSTDSFSNVTGWGYIILYAERGEAHE